MGLIAGGVSAFITTPLDVMKTRIMLSADLPVAQRRGILATFRQLQSEGMRKMFAGAVPRTMWISLGGAVWFGAFEEYRRLLNRLLNWNNSFFIKREWLNDSNSMICLFVHSMTHFKVFLNSPFSNKQCNSESFRYSTIFPTGMCLESECEYPLHL